MKPSGSNPALFCETKPHRLSSRHVARNLNACVQNFGNLSLGNGSTGTSGEVRGMVAERMASDDAVLTVDQMETTESTVIALSASRSFEHHHGVSSLRPIHLGRRSGRSKMSHALLRGLWRWREGLQSQKKRRKYSGNGGNDGSSGSGEFLGVAPAYGSDPTTEPITMSASASYGILSDVPQTGESSSGELYLSSGGKRDPRKLSADVSPGVKVLDFSEESFSRFIGDVPSGDSGYGSEIGYGGDGELGYDDWADQDEDPTDPSGDPGLNPRQFNPDNSAMAGVAPRTPTMAGSSPRPPLPSVGRTHRGQRLEDDVRIWASMMRRLARARAQEESGLNPGEDVVSELLSFDQSRLRRLHQRMRRRRRHIVDFNKSPLFSGRDVHRDGDRHPRVGQAGGTEGGNVSGYEEEDIEGRGGETEPMADQRAPRSSGSHL